MIFIMLLVDTNILAYLLIEGDLTSKVQDLYRCDADWHSDEFILVEFSNILATYVRTGDLTFARAASLLARAETLLSGRLASVPHAEALAMAHKCRVSVYDARFLVAADSRRARLVTEDQSLQRAAPDLTWSLEEGISSVKSH
jgi:predicted nucleic acid-binding protein